MTSKVCDPKLTLENLSEQLTKWKQPYLQSAKQTTEQLQSKVRDFCKQTIAKYVTAEATESQPQKYSVLSSERYQQRTAEIQSYKAKTEQKISTTLPYPQLQYWKSNIEYAFKDYDELKKSYGEVFRRKQKVKKGKTNESVEDFRVDEREMINEIYEELKNPLDNTVSFEAIEQFFQNFDLFYYFYNVYPHRLLNQLKEVARKYQNKLTKQYFFDFFLIDRVTVCEFKAATQKNVSNICILSEEMWKKLKSIFDTLDTFGNEMICIKTFFQRIQNSPSSLSLLSAETIRFPEIGRVYTLQKVLFDMENKMNFTGKVDWQTLYNSINGFLHLYYPTLDVIYAKNIQTAKISKHSNYFLLKPNVLETIKQIFSKCPKYCDSFVKTSFLTEYLFETELLKLHMNAATRLSTNNEYLNLDEVLGRFCKDAPKYIDMDEMLELLSIKGLQNTQKLIDLYNDVASSSSEDETEEQKSERKLKKIKSMQQLKKTKRKEKTKRISETTRTKYFHLFQRKQPTIREQKVQYMIKYKLSEDEAELKKKFKANPIPATTNQERYQRYLKCLQQKKESIFNRLEMKRYSDYIHIEYLKSNTKLFEQKKLTNHCEKPKPIYKYEASPLPSHVSEELLPIIEAEKAERRRRLWEESNKMYIEGFWKNIKETVNPSNAKGDSLVEKIHNTEQKQRFEQMKAKEVPNFEYLHRQFEDELRRRKRQFKPTKIEYFKFSSPSQKKAVSPNEGVQPHRFQSLSPPKSNAPVSAIKSTKKYDDWIAFNQSRMAEKELKLLEKETEEYERLTKQRNFAKYMRKNLANCTDNTAILRKNTEYKIRKFRQRIAQLYNTTETELAQIYARVLQRPFLFEETVSASKLTAKQRSKETKEKVANGKAESPYQRQYNAGLFEKEGDEFHPMYSENLNQSY